MLIKSPIKIILFVDCQLMIDHNSNGFPALELGEVIFIPITKFLGDAPESLECHDCQIDGNSDTIRHTGLMGLLGLTAKFFQIHFQIALDLRE